ncbi:putative secreted protein [Frankia sp. AiPs1]|uniref:hypothetical protein n=1 Tax=Frankia sp. AiPa1 TaxID=573492 RepID=UPI00202B7588|nr:hypothetical protein [Frankia sp. AiPa1]MCL9761755.1 hypothetical protein [Frankia sp. AiPa1]
MSVAGWTLLAIAAAVLIVTAALVDRRGGGGPALRRRFGPEYDRAVAEFGSRGAAHRHLLAVAERRDALTLAPLTEADRTAFARRWQAVQSRFVDDPLDATRKAGTLVGEVMSARGYPDGDVRQRAELLSVDHPELAVAYRQAHISARSATGPGNADGKSGPGGRNGGTGGNERVDTEDLRRAFVHFRELFDRLAGPASRGITGEGHRAGQAR